MLKKDCYVLTIYMRRQSNSSPQIWPIPAWVLTLGGLALLLFLIACYILFWPRHPDAPRGGPARPSQTSQLAAPSKLRQRVPEAREANPGNSASSSAPAPTPSKPVLPPPPIQVTVPADAQIPIRTTTLIDSNADPVGSRFAGTVTSPIVVNGQTVIPQGSAVVLHLADKKKTGFFHRSLEMKVALTGIAVNGRIYPIQAGILSVKAGKNNGVGENGSPDNPTPKGKKALVILPNTEMSFTLTAPFTVVFPSAPDSGSANGDKGK